MKNNSVSFFFTQRDTQTDPPTAAAATTRDDSARHRDTQIPEGMAGPSSKEGFSPFLLPHQEGLTWADPSLWLSPGHFLYILQPCLVRSDEKAPMTHSKDMSLCLGLARHIILQIFSMVGKREFIASFGGRCDWVDSLSLFL